MEIFVRRIRIWRFIFINNLFFFFKGRMKIFERLLMWYLKKKEKKFFSRVFLWNVIRVWMNLESRKFSRVCCFRELFFTSGYCVVRVTLLCKVGIYKYTEFFFELFFFFWREEINLEGVYNYVHPFIFHTNKYLSSILFPRLSILLQIESRKVNCKRKQFFTDRFVKW